MANHSNKGRRHGGAPRKQHKASPRTPKRGGNVPSVDTHTPFSLREEAKNSEHNTGWWSSDLKLRHKNVTFVSAGHLHGDRPSPPTPDGKLEEPSRISAESTDGDRAVTENTATLARLSIAQQDHQSPSTPAADIVPPEAATVLQNSGRSNPAQQSSNAVKSDAPSPAPPLGRQPSPTPSNSSEDVVLFKGRALLQSTDTNHVSREPSPLPPPPIHASSPSLARSLVRNEEGGEAGDGDSASVQSGEMDDRDPSSRHQKKPRRGDSRSKGKRKGTHRNKRQRAFPESDVDDDAVADYLANLEENGEELPTIGNGFFSSRSLALDDANEFAGLQEMTSRKERPRAVFEDAVEDGWDRSMLDDLDALSTSSDIVADIERIVGKRFRQGKTQYLVVYQGSLVDDARWLPANFLTQEEDLMLVDAFESQSKERGAGRFASWAAESSEELVESPDEEDSSEDEEDDEDDYLDERDLVQRRVDRMTDEQIARALAKQEELGFSADEVFLFNDETFDSQVYLEELPGSSTALSHGRTKQRRKAKRAQGDYPSASLMAEVLEQDPYGGFDIMDFDRPSLRKKKGRHVEASDEETEAHLQSVWEADRKKKRLQKQQRQELRAQGLLGKKNKFKPDLGVKYQDGFTSSQMMQEIKEFWVSSLESRAFPPMDKKDRKILHEVAVKLDMSSKSRGSGKNRFPVLSKTKRTPDFDESLLFRVEKMANRRFGGGFSASTAGPTRNRNAPTASYRNGEVVGAGAPEIGAENRGRAMLEKMGWTSGTALGATDNKGILEPISHTFKATKHGLGQ